MTRRYTSISLATAALIAISSPAVAGAQSSSSSLSSLFEGSSAPGGGHYNLWQEIPEALTVKMIGDVLGTHQHVVGLGAVDLGIMFPLGLGEQFGMIFGDSFTGNGFGQGDWLSPVGVRAELDENGRIRFTRPLNDGARVEQLIDYQHDNGLTLIPSDVINLDGTLYMQGMWNQGIGNVRRTQTWKSTDYGATWQSVGTTPATFMDGMGNLISWEKGPDGYIYVASSGFKRSHPVYLSRFRADSIETTDRSNWEHFNPQTGIWGSEAQPILTEDLKAGEMCLRFIDGHWVLAMFNELTASIEVRVSPTIATDWNAIKPAHVVVATPAGWSQPQDADNFAQLYGGYIVPGSTLENFDVVVSQWKTSNNSRYTATQFNVKGLDAFFGITPSPQPASGDQNAVDVVESPVTPDTEGKLTEERAVERAADVA